MNVPTITLATNNGDIGGGEVMLLGIATALRELGLDVTVAGPSSPGALLDEAAGRGLRTTRLPAHGRPEYMTALRRWRREHRSVPLWCNGLVPSTATAGQGPRLVHLHGVPRGAQRAAVSAATLGARRVLVPSRWIATRIPGTRVLENWTSDLDFRPRSLPTDRPVRIGYLGRLTQDKGVDTLVRAVGHLSRRDGDGQGAHVRLLLAGENRFGTAEDDAALAEALASAPGLVEQRGWMPREELLDEVDLLVVPSIAPETFGLVAAEAMAAGTPVIVSDAGALPEVVGGTAAGIARAGDVDDLAHVMERALRRSTAEHEALVAAARRRWETRYSLGAGTRRIADLLSELSAGGAA